MNRAFADEFRKTYLRWKLIDLGADSSFLPRKWRQAKTAARDPRNMLWVLALMARAHIGVDLRIAIARVRYSNRMEFDGVLPKILDCFENEVVTALPIEHPFRRMAAARPSAARAGLAVVIQILRGRAWKQAQKQMRRYNAW